MHAPIQILDLVDAPAMLKLASDLQNSRVGLQAQAIGVKSSFVAHCLLSRLGDGQTVAAAVEAEFKGPVPAKKRSIRTSEEFRVPG